MSIDSMIRSAEQVDREETARWNRNNPRPGNDDNLHLLEHLAKVKAMTRRWKNSAVNANFRDADEQASRAKWLAEYVMETWGWTIAEYDQWVCDENRRQRDKWTSVDFNEKQRRMII